MKLIVISPAKSVLNEREIVISLLENELDSYQVYKPSLSREEIQSYLGQFPVKYRDKIVLHSQFPKFHSLKELENYREDFEYAFLSPVFDSISKNGYRGIFDLAELKEKIPSLKRKIIALGGIDEDKIEIVHRLGFAGVAVLGAIWESNNPLEKFIRLKTLCQKKDLAY